MRTPINLAIKLITAICVILGNIYKEAKLLPASILTMSKHIEFPLLKRKLSNSSEMQQAPLSYAAMAAKIPAKGPPHSGSLHGKNSGQGNHNRQGPRGRDDIRNTPPHTSFQPRKSSSSSSDRNIPQGHQGPIHTQNQSFGNSANYSNNKSKYNNQPWKKGGKGENKGGHRGKDRGRYESSQTSQVYNQNRNRGYDKSSGSGSEYQVPDFSDRQESQTMHHQSSTTNTPQSRQNSESNDWFGTSSLPVMTSHSSDSSSKFPCSESVVSHSLTASEENQASNLSPEFPPLSDQTRNLAATPKESLSLSNPPAGSKSKAETMSSPTSSKKPPGWSGPDPGTEGRKKSGPKNTSQGNARPVLTDTKTVESQESGKGKGLWKGVDINELRRAPECFGERMSLEAGVNESADLQSDRPESQEHRKKFVVPSYVFLPHHQQPGIAGSSFRWGWDQIMQILSNQITNPRDLEAVMANIAYHNPHHNPQNNRYHGPQSNPYERPDFRALEAYFQTLTEEQYNRFFYVTLPSIQELALQLPLLFQKPLLILKKQTNQEVTLSQRQVACLLANAFFNTFPEQTQNRNEKLQMPDFNFINLYTQMKSERKVEKLKCIVHYFERVTTKMPNGNVTYKRVYREPKGWMTLEAGLTKLHVATEGTIEDTRGFLQADFANKFVGGGVLNTGLVQEEIRFVLCPEMIVSRLITEMLTDDEALVMIGCERFSSYSGYSDSFKFTGRFDDETESDERDRKCTEVVAMDASVFKTDFYEQFKMRHVTRELNKAHCAFKGSGVRNLPVCTGNWGCGAFGGDKQLKALIQLMAASVANRDICYLTFGDAELCLQIGHIYDILKTRNMSIRDIMEILTLYSKSNTDDPLFTFMEKTIYGNVHTAEKPIKPQEKSTKSDFTKNTNVQSKSPKKHNK